jgi:hypothetical protein
MLTERFVNDDLPARILSRADYRPYPTIDDRAAYEGLPPEVRAARIAVGEEYLRYDWPPLPATLFMEYRRTGNRSNYEAPHFARRRALASLVLAECVETQGRFLDEIINGIWCLCEESFWGIPAHNELTRHPGAPLPDTSDRSVDLFAAETAGLLAWTVYLLGGRLDAVSPVIGERIRRETRVRVLDIYLLSDASHWMGLSPDTRNRPVNNWNPWCNSNCLSAAMLLEDDPARRVGAVTKALRSLDRFLDSYKPDGGCDEGPGYWDRAGGSLFDCLDILGGATAGAIDIWSEPLVQNIGRFLYRAQIADNYYVNFADGGAKVRISADLAYRFGRRIGDDRLTALGRTTFQQTIHDGVYSDVPQSLLRALPALFDFAALSEGEAVAPLIRDVWMPGIEVMAAREHEGSDRGFFVAAKGGHNAESHNHNDVGQCIVFYNAEPVLVDVGVEVYTAKTFGPNRYDIWTMQSGYHNLPVVGGFDQAAGEGYAARAVAYRADDTAASLTLDIAGAYPADAGIRSWRRTVRLERGAVSEVQIIEDFALDTAKRIELHYMSVAKPDLEQAGRIRLAAGADFVALDYNPVALSASTKRIDLTDPRLAATWGEALYRTTLTSRADQTAGLWTLRITALGNKRED